MIDARRLCDACFHAAVALASLYRHGRWSCRGFRALVLSAGAPTAPGSDAAALGPRTVLQSTDAFHLHLLSE